MAQINLGGSIGSAGSQSILGNAAVVFATNANHTLTAAEYSNKFLEVTSGVSLTATRNLVAPLNQGQEFYVQNKTTGGQALQIIGATGTGVVVPNGATVAVVCDGTNYTEVSGGGGGGGGIVIVTPVAGAATIDCSLGSVFYMLLTANVTLTFTNITPGQILTMMLQQDATGNWTVDWSSAVLYVTDINPNPTGRTLQPLYTWPDSTLTQQGWTG